MRVYLCGPMRGHSSLGSLGAEHEVLRVAERSGADTRRRGTEPAWNAAAFDRYAAEWKLEGHTVLSPVARDRLQGLDPTTATREELVEKARDGVWLRQVIAEDMEMICKVDALAVLSGWEASTGATVEVALALFLGLPVYLAISREEVYPAPVPWSRLLHMPVRVLDAMKEGG